MQLYRIGEKSCSNANQLLETKMALQVFLVIRIHNCEVCCGLVLFTLWQVVTKKDWMEPGIWSLGNLVRLKNLPSSP